MTRIGLYISKKDWDAEVCRVKKSHRNSSRLNAVISKRIADAESLVLEADLKGVPFKDINFKEMVLSSEHTDFFEYSDRYLQELEAGKRVGMLKRAKTVITKLKDFHGEKPLYLDTITRKYLIDYEKHLRKKCNNKTNTVNSNFRVLKKILKDAMGDGLLSRDSNPFNSYSLKTAKTTRVFLTTDELDSIKGLDLKEGSAKDHARNIFIFACYAGGVRISDLLTLQWKQVAGGRLLISTKKTGNIQNVKLGKEATGIIEKLRQETSEPEDFVFPYIKSLKEIDTPEKLHGMISKKTALVNKYLAEIGEKATPAKKLSTHIARHTFATLALKQGMRIEYVSKLLGHANIRETQIYAKIVDAELDKAMEEFDK
jgi:integrase